MSWFIAPHVFGSIAAAPRFGRSLLRHHNSLSLQEIFAIDDAFREAGSEIAFPQQEVTIKAVDVPIPSAGPKIMDPPKGL